MRLSPAHSYPLITSTNLRPIYTSPVIPALQSIDWHRFLARPPLPSPSDLAAIHDASILITGAGGSIGSALALRLAELAPAHLVLLESSESRLFELQRDLSSNFPRANTTFVLGNIDHPALLEEIFSIHALRIVFHAAAYKQVPLLESHPLAAIENNVFGTQNLISTASTHRARVILLSTDKAVVPASIMGATKRIAELITLAAGGSVLRLGNVLASRDSVAEVFATGIARRETIVVTDPAARRYFLTLDEAVDLLLAAAVEPNPPVLLAPALPAPHFVADLARFMACTLAPDRETRIDFSSLRPGDKESELLWSTAEHVRPAMMQSLLSIHSPQPNQIDLRNASCSLRAAVDTRDVAASLEFLRNLVPDYTPSSVILSLAATSNPRVSP